MIRTARTARRRNPTSKGTNRSFVGMLLNGATVMTTSMVMTMVMVMATMPVVAVNVHSSPTKTNTPSTPTTPTATTTTTTARTVVPQRRLRFFSRRRRRQDFMNNFRWEASVDSDTGLASSIEQSTSSRSSSSSSGSGSSSIVLVPKNRDGGGGNDNSFLSNRQQGSFVGSWPDFICRGDVTFGLFRIATTTTTTEEAKTTKKREITISCLQPRFVPITLLKFGEISRTTTPTTTSRQSFRRTKRNRRNKDDDDDSEEKEDSLSTNMMSWEIPIMGGILALPSSLSRTTMDRKRPGNQSRSTTNWGKLVFGIDRVTYDQRGRSSSTTSSPSSASSSSSPSSTNNNSTNSNKNHEQHVRYELTTRIVDYRPRLAGYPPHRPHHHQAGKDDDDDDDNNRNDNLVSFINTSRRITFPVRKWFYLHSQSYVHAYIAWRFHKSWHGRLLNKREGQSSCDDDR